MASQTKIEPIERAHTKAATDAAGASTQVIDSERQGSEPPAPSSSVASSASGHHAAADDEDVSLDELMMSDAPDGDVELGEPADARNEDAVATDPTTSAGGGSDEATALEEGQPGVGADPFETDQLDDEAASLAAAAAAQEAAAQAAEAEARAAAARRASELPTSAPRSSAEASSRRSSAPPPAIPEAPASVAARLAEEPTLPGPATGAWDLEPPRSTLPGLEPSRSGELPMSSEFEPPIGVDFDGLEPGATVASAPSIPVALTPPTPTPRLNGPLPSFDIPAESARAGRHSTIVSDDTASRVSPRPPAPALSHLSEASEEDDDDAVTHIGLPVVPEASDYPELEQGGFQVANRGMTPLRGYEPEAPLEDARRATTRVVQRIDTAQLEQRRDMRDTNPALSSGGRRAPGGVGAWLSGLLQRVRSTSPRADVLPRAGRRSGWLLDTVLPPLSLVLFGSGIGAGIMLLQPDRGAKAAQQAQSIHALREAPMGKRPTTLTERAEAGDGEALFKITNMSPSDRTSALTLALERGQQAQKQNEFKEFARQLDAPGGLQTPNITTRFLAYATAPETMLPAFAHLLAWPGTVGPDVLYAVWEKAPGGNRAASLAQQLLHSADQRAKATPALITALDLRSATSCEDYLRVLPAVKRDGDQRCSATLRALKHTDGCGDDGQRDCFACLRDGRLLDDALVAIEGRVAPQL